MYNVTTLPVLVSRKEPSKILSFGELKLRCTIQHKKVHISNNVM